MLQSPNLNFLEKESSIALTEESQFAEEDREDENTLES
jgi:hypothetical protein